MELRRTVHYEIWVGNSTESTWNCTKTEAEKIAGWLVEAGFECSIQRIVTGVTAQTVAKFEGRRKAI